MNTAFCNTAKTGTVETLLAQFPNQAGEKNKAMILEITCEVDKVIDKLETLANLFEFYWYAREKTGFNADSINGLTIIISDCIADLKEAVRHDPN